MWGVILAFFGGAVVALAAAFGISKARRPSAKADAARLGVLDAERDRAESAVELANAERDATDRVDAAVASDDPGYADWLHGLNGSGEEPP